MNIHVLGEEEVFLLHKLLYRDGNIHYFHKIMSILKKDEYVWYVEEWRKGMDLLVSTIWENDYEVLLIMF